MATAPTPPPHHHGFAPPWPPHLHHHHISMAPQTPINITQTFDSNNVIYCSPSLIYMQLVCSLL
ncbi:hypothetical protein Hanom_Chr10g00920951 [Helianthus anomalus]